MTRIAVFFVALCSFLVAQSQESFFVLKKKGKTIQRFSTGSLINFELRSGDWISGHITKLGPDSFYVRQQSIRYSMFGADTVHFGIMKVAITDIARMPRKSALFFYRNDKVQIIHGHEKFVYVKSGLIFQLAGGGYAALNIAGSLFNHEPPFAKKNIKRLSVAALVFGIGEILHLTYRQYLRLGRKYQLKYISLDKPMRFSGKYF